MGNAAFIGLPGNPVAAMVTFMVIARSVILMLSGAMITEATRYPIKVGFDYAKKLGRKEWVRVRVKLSDAGCLTAYKIHSGGSGILTSLVDADGLLELSENMEVLNKGQTVDFLPFNEVTR